MNLDYQLIINYLRENITFEMFFKFILVYFFIIWISLLVWVVKDIANRTENIFLQLLSVLIILLLTPLGIFVYLIIRPGKTLFEKYYEEIEENLDAVEDLVEYKNKKEEETILCYKCSYPISHDFKFCPNCNIKLKKDCNSCHKIINTGWKNCPFCGEENKIELNSDIFSEPKINYLEKKVENNKLQNLEKKIENKIVDVEDMIDKIINEQDKFEKTI